MTHKEGGKSLGDLFFALFLFPFSSLFDLLWLKEGGESRGDWVLSIKCDITFERDLPKPYLYFKYTDPYALIIIADTSYGQDEGLGVQQWEI